MTDFLGVIPVCCVSLQSQDSSLLYGVCQTLVNLTNTYDTPDIPEEMKKLGEFAKVNLPKFHDKVTSIYKHYKIIGFSRFNCDKYADTAGGVGRTKHVLTRLNILSHWARLNPTSILFFRTEE